MSKTTLTHFFGCVCAVICAVTSFFTFIAVRGALEDYMQTGEAMNVLAYPSILIFGVIAVGTFCMTLSAFVDKILAAIQSPVAHPVLRLFGITPTSQPKVGHARSRRASFFNLNSWQVGGILAVVLFFVGIGWYHWSWLVGKFVESTTYQIDAIPHSHH